MSNPFNNSLARPTTTTNPTRVWKTYQHATKLYLGGFRMAKTPKLGFMYYVSFELSPGLKSDQWNKIKNSVGFLAKKVDLPKFKLTTQTINQYNRKTNIQTKIAYDPVNIEFHDDNSQITSSLWRLYYDYYYQDGRNKNGKFDPAWYGDTKYDNQEVYGYDAPNNSSFFSNIDMFVFHNGRYSQYSIANPFVSQWDHDSLDQTNGTKILQNKITFVYDAVSYHEGEIPVGDEQGDETIAPAIQEADFYDHDVNLTKGYSPANKPYTVSTPHYPTPQPAGPSRSQLDKLSANSRSLSTARPPQPLGAGTIGLSSLRPRKNGIAGVDVWYGYGGLHGRAVINAGPIQLAIKK